MATNRNVITNTFAQFGGKIGTVIASFTVVKIVSGYGTEFYGDYVTAYEFLAFFGVFADAGLFAIAVRDISRKALKPDFVLGNILAMRLGLIALAVLIAGLAAQLIPTYSDAVKTGIWITGLSMGLTIIAGSLSAILQARMKIYLFSSSLVMGKIILAALVFAISSNFLLPPATGTDLFLRFLWAGVISNLIFCVLVLYWAAREVPLKLQYDKEYWVETARTSLPYGLALVLQTLYLRADLIIISLLLGSASVGIYGVSARVLESFLVLGVFFGQALLPKLAGNDAEADHTLQWGLEKAALFALPIMIGTMAFAPQIIELLSSAQYLTSSSQIGSDKLLYILVPTVLFAFMNQIFTFALVSKNQQKKLLLINALALILNITLNLIFIPQYGLMAAAVSTVICELLVFGLLFKLARKNFTWPVNFSNWAFILGANGLLYLGLKIPFLATSLPLAVLVSGIYYVTFILLFRKNLQL
ncbi:oligosaccharide flippase family protein [bacterium]|nr:oligosaccharide flippase family protein [bacterium]NCQ55691.1 oligosaccharide flippase family protein [Candidatus Parcubacteria bacterium]NCS67640.1 oligosaccharide flippase family protein [Candidatus Peregrinibacteria bacterium]NCS96654.1 oligosaccharide flippase family protein [bacterium]